jgi:hypothetical protein
MPTSVLTAYGRRLIHTVRGLGFMFGDSGIPDAERTHPWHIPAATPGASTDARLFDSEQRQPP